MPEKDSRHKILWLASYPKSGNTWFRAFISALKNEGTVEINALATDGIFSERAVFDDAADVESRDLYDRESRAMMADVYRYIARDNQKLSIIKIHDAYLQDMDGHSIVPDDVTHCGLYFVRNPLDIAGSLANHLNCPIQEAVNLINNSNGCLAKQLDNNNKFPQMTQLLLDWSGHVKSWVDGPSFPVHVIRYEDMLNNTYEVFANAVDFIGWKYTGAQIKAALAASSFEMLHQQEAQKGFREKAVKSNVFFRSGTMHNWKHELSEEQIVAIESQHRDMMKDFNYLRTRN